MPVLSKRSSAKLKPTLCPVDEEKRHNNNPPTKKSAQNPLIGRKKVGSSTLKKGICDLTKEAAKLCKRQFIE